MFRFALLVSALALAAEDAPAPESPPAVPAPVAAPVAAAPTSFSGTYKVVSDPAAVSMITGVPMPCSFNHWMNSMPFIPGM